MKVGATVGIVVRPGEDWKNVSVDSSEPAKKVESQPTKQAEAPAVAQQHQEHFDDTAL